MMLTSLALLLAAAAGLQQPASIDGPIYPLPSTTAFFEFAPANGAGMGAACACTTPTGAKGEAMTFARGSSGTCLKTVGVAPQAVANGDMVTCSSNQPRLMPGADGTGINGLLAEPSRTNVALQSQAFDNAAWLKSGSVAAAPTITANAAVAPDGTTTAERVQIPSVSSGFSLLQQTGLGGAGTYSEGVWAKGNGQSGTFIIDLGNVSCLTCSYTNGVWARCKQEARALGAAAVFSIGQDVADCGGGPFGAQDFFLWQAQMEAGSYISSDIATAGASAARNADRPADFGLAWPSSMGISLASTVVLPSTVTANVTIVGAYFDTNNPGDGSSTPYIYPFWDGTNFDIDMTGSASAATGYTSTLSPTFNGGARYVAYHDGARMNVCVNGTCAAGTNSTWLNVALRRFQIGGAGTGANTFTGGVIKQVCVDPNPLRCR